MPSRRTSRPSPAPVDASGASRAGTRPVPRGSTDPDALRRYRPAAVIRRYLAIMALVYVAWGALYLLTAWIGQLRGPAFDPALPLDADIPFIPAAQPVYMLAYVVVLGLFVISRDPAVLNRAYTAFLLANGAAFVFFALFPAQGPPRDSIPAGSGLEHALLALVHAVDSRYNALPSLHVTNPWLVALFALHVRGHSLHGVVFPVLALSITVSTLLVRQHYVLDAVAGMALAGLAFAVALRLPLSSRAWGPELR